MSYPIEKYKYYVDNKGKVIAVSSYAGKTIRGVAKCDPKDEFSLEKGKRLAAARCALKIADKRVARANHKLAEAEDMLEIAYKRRDKMDDYVADAYDAKYGAEDALNMVLEEL